MSIKLQFFGFIISAATFACLLWLEWQPFLFPTQ